MLNFLTSLLFYSNEISAQKGSTGFAAHWQEHIKTIFASEAGGSGHLCSVWRMVSPFPPLNRHLESMVVLGCFLLVM